MNDDKQFDELISDFEIDHEKMSEIIEEHANEGGLVVASEVLPTGLPILYRLNADTTVAEKREIAG